MSITVRHAESSDDYMFVVRTGGQLCSQSPVFQSLRFDAVEFYDFLMALQSYGCGYAAIGCHDDNPDEPIAAMIGVLEKSFIGPDTVAHDAGLFVPEENRQSGVGAALIAHFTNWAKDNGAKMISCGNSAGFDDAVYQTAMARSGYQRAGSLMYRIEGD